MKNKIIQLTTVTENSFIIWMYLIIPTISFGIMLIDIREIIVKTAVPQLANENYRTFFVIVSYIFLLLVLTK